MENRQLGKLTVSAMGLGCMGMSEFYGQTDDDESIKVIHAALDSGITMLDTADMYGIGHNEELVGRAVKGRRDSVVIATKFGIVREKGKYERTICGTPEYVRSACEASLRRLGIDTIDLYYQHRKDPNVAIEETVGAMAELVKEGKVRHLGLSECSAETLRRASKVHTITALQTEYSLWTRDIEAQILPACRELGIGLVAYSPLGRGFLTGALSASENLDEKDFRRLSPRFSGDNLKENAKMVDELSEVSKKIGCTNAQLALAWVLSKGRDIVPIPGTKRIKYLNDNLEACNIRLSAENTAEIERIVSPERVKGARYPEEGMKGLNG
ncbi:aldo/keto reductase [Seleniivibrio sp.]|uniref:aldo/keto reductase n=1 Tax=Seleniivibrio sp. TaxID=2898801 RepID=UPI0025E25EC6|nr:aldo/keto reductase [Seleniivibrio sp.]MCD8553422.1 aldo/keto reductase [Seleniivibrio sp.]